MLLTFKNKFAGKRLKETIKRKDTKIHLSIKLIKMLRNYKTEALGEKIIKNSRHKKKRTKKWKK